MEKTSKVQPARGPVLDAIERYYRLMFFVCFKILGDRDRAQDACHEAVLRALSNPPQKFDKDPQAWLCKVARNTTIEILRRGQPQGDGVRSKTIDPYRDVQIRLDTQRLLACVWDSLDIACYEDAERFLTVALGVRTRKELAAQLHVAPAVLKAQYERGRTAVTNAATAICLTIDAANGRRACEVPGRLVADAERWSPELRRRINKHAAKCKRCTKRSEDTKGLLSTILSTIGFALGWPHIRKLLGADTQVKVTLAATATSVAMVVGVVMSHDAPLPGRALPMWPPTSTVTPAPVSAAVPSTRPAPEAPAVTAVPAPQILPTTSTRTPLLPTTTIAPPTTTATGKERSENLPEVTGYTVEHRRIATTNDGTCESQPTTSAVSVTVTSDIVSAELLTTMGRDSVSKPMNRGGVPTRWAGRIGPFSDTYSHRTAQISVLITTADGRSVIEQLGEVCLTTCTDR
jgi:RNA polymerase sigma-70 factor (ECF subfamily)